MSDRERLNDRENRKKKKRTSRSRHRDHRDRSRSRIRSRSPLSNNSGLMQGTLDAILLRLNHLESDKISSTPSQYALDPPVVVPVVENIEVPASQSKDFISAQTLLDIIKILPDRSKNYFVSNFDPMIHNIDTWCEEVDRAQQSNAWEDCECLSRVANCLKGDAKNWLNEWATSDRSWSNFKREFKPLCSRRLDFANILFEVMNTTSDKYASYAEYARRSLLRLRIIKGLSEELMTQIVIRGLTDAQVRAAATNANLSTDNLVQFLSIYLKPSRPTHNVRAPLQKSRINNGQKDNAHNIKCFSCGEVGHKKQNCTKQPKTTEKCAFCKKPGHSESDCFAKNRSGTRNQRNINLCVDNVSRSLPIGDNNITSAVVQGVPVDVLIDSGALEVSLISSEALKHFTCEIKPLQCDLKGVSREEVKANSYVTLQVELPDITVEVDLVVVPADCMSTPIIIGTDVLNREGVVYVRTKDRQYLAHANVNHVTAAVSGSVKGGEALEIKTPLQGSDREKLMSVIDEFSDFFISGTASTTVTTGSMHISLTSETPVAYRPYRMSFQEKVKVRDIVKDLLNKGVIRESESPYSSPILLVKKKDGSDRMCVDFRALNKITARDRYPLPLIDDHIDRLGNHKFFSSLDMATGFHQIKLDEDSIPKTGFVTPEAHYEYLKMPYGLANSPIVYQRIINNTLRKFIDEGHVLVYIDDVLIMSSTVDEGLDRLSKVLKTLTEAGFSINLRKCSFLSTEVEYLGRVVSEGQVKPSPQKVKALVNSPAPSTVKNVRQFLGLAGYFRRYVKDYALRTACIAHLTKKNVKFEWSSEQEKARQDIVNCLTSEPILAVFDPELPTELHTDASSIAYGAVLMQTHSDGKKRVVSYFSKVTQGAESKYHSYELETLAVVRALQHLRHYLIGLEFKLVTDCNALKSTKHKKDLLPRVARWWVYLQDFNFTIEYRKGQMMSHADYFSRNPPVQVNQVTKPRNWAQIAQAADDETQNLVQKLNDGQLDPQRYALQNDILHYRYTPVGEKPRLLCFIPRGHRLSLLRLFHDEHQHISAEKTQDLILKHFWFPGLRQFVSKYVSHCLVCISKKRVPRAPHQLITSWEKPDEPFRTVHVDALGPLPESNGFKFVLIIIDAFTKFALLYPMYRQDVTELTRVFKSAISMFGVPKLLVTDRGRMFESAEFVRWVKELGSDIHYITPEMHQSNGQVERYARTVLNMIRIESARKDVSWSDVLWRLQLVLNITKQKTTQRSPLSLLVGTEASTPAISSLIRDLTREESDTNREAWREICRSQARSLLTRNRSQQDAYVNQRRKPSKNYNINDLVFVIKYSQSVGKLDPGMRGPYKVTKVLPSGRYELRLLSGAYGKTTQAAAEYMVPWQGEWCPETCAAFFANNEVNAGDLEAGPSSRGSEDNAAPAQDDGQAGQDSQAGQLDNRAVLPNAVEGEADSG